MLSWLSSLTLPVYLSADSPLDRRVANSLPARCRSSAPSLPPPRRAIAGLASYAAPATPSSVHHSGLSPLPSWVYRRRFGFCFVSHRLSTGTHNRTHLISSIADSILLSCLRSRSALSSQLGGA